MVDGGEGGEREFSGEGGSGRRGLGARGGFTDIGCDDLSFVAGEYDIGCYANARVSVKDVRFGIITCKWAVPSRKRSNRTSGIVDVDFL